jgi:Recombinase zinc beta ribbon domain
VRFRRAGKESVVRSRRPAHPDIVSVETFTETQLKRRTKAAGGLASARKAERGGRATTKRPYLLRGLVRCGICRRKMQGASIRKGVYYRCIARTLAPGAAALADHPRTVNLREEHLLEPLNGWIGRLFDRDNVDRTVAEMVASQDGGGAAVEYEAAKKRLAEVETALRRHQGAIAAGVDPAALVEVINAAQAEREAARATLATVGRTDALTDAEVYAMIDSLGDIGAALRGGTPASLTRLYEGLRLQLRYEPQEQAVYVSASPRVVSERVRGGT